MTIDQHLEFSVLTAPLASFDRRALSQAWYSALYGQTAGAPRAAKTALPKPPASRARTAANKPQQTGSPHAAPQNIRVAGKSARPARHAAGELERRAPASSMAKRIETSLRRCIPAQRFAFSLESAHGRVQILLRRQGAALKIVALCAPGARSEVAAALAHARYALALRGIDLDARVRGEAAC